MNLKELFPNASFVKTKIDTITREYEVIAAGFVPKIKPDRYDLFERYNESLEYMDTKAYKQLNDKSQKAFNQFQQNLLIALQNEYLAESEQGPQSMDQAAASFDGSGNQQLDPAGLQAPTEGFVQNGSQRPEEGRRILPDQEM